MLSSKIDAYIMLFAIYLDGTVYISELFWNFLSFIHNNRIIMGGHFFLSTHCMVWSVALNSLCKHRYVSYQVSIVLSRKQPIAEF